MKQIVYVLILLLWGLTLKAQLLPAVGLNALPSGNALVCKEPFYLGSFYATGYQQGDTVPDFKLYDLNGDSLVLSQALSGGKPVLLIGGSLTCPVFRAKVATINKVVSTYSAHINIYVIYTLEAHPTDTSVYFGYVNVTSQNTSAGILFPQPKTYGERRNIVDTMSHFVNLNAPVFIDGPCNNWWKNFGPAPNNSYIIGTNGVVLNKHGWFHKSPDNIFCDLDSILSLNKGLCLTSPTVPGSFSVNVLNNTVTGLPGDLLYNYVDIVNTSSVAATIKIKKMEKDHPPGWQSAFCADVCYGIMDDSIEVSVDAYDTLHFSLDFFTDSLPDSGNVRVGFKNLNKSNNSFSLWLQAKTSLKTVGLAERARTDANTRIFPNPATNYFYVITPDINTPFSVYDHRGKKTEASLNGNKIDTSQWPDGIYFIVFRTHGDTCSKKIIIAR